MGNKIEGRLFANLVTNKRPLLIAGIDVGHHTSIVLLDISGKIVNITTFVNPQNSEVLEYMIKNGNVLVVSTDRSKPPSQMKKIVASISAKMILPSKNMTKKKKRLIIEAFLKKGGLLPKKRLNDHEKSALASAIFAYRKFVPSFKKLEDKFKNEEEHLLILKRELFLKMVKDI
jgi:predicted RNase H-like nuclease (RuvC/YqgF family)